MTFQEWMIIIPGVCYALEALVSAYKREWPEVIVYSGYAWGNVGLWWMHILMKKAPGG